MPYRKISSLLLMWILLGSIFGGTVNADVTATIKKDMNVLQGASVDGRVLLYAPDPVEPGSSISHWDNSAFPNLLMEPSINADLPFLGLDITPSLMLDIGWQTGASNFAIYDLDPVGTGFTDPTPFSGAPGNPATTLGDARWNVVSAVLNVWASQLASNVDVDVLVTWVPLTCVEGQGAVLGAAGSLWLFLDDSLPEPDLWYPAALTEALVGFDVTGPPDQDGGDILVLLNSDLDNECMGPDTGIYYGLDGNAPPNMIELTTVLIHELAHGLGMSSIVDETDGSLLQGYAGIYDKFVFDDIVDKTWTQMGADVDRAVSARNTRHLVWNGAHSTAAAAAYLDPGTVILDVVGPAQIAGNYFVGTANFGPAVTEIGLSGKVIIGQDGSAGPDGTGATTDGCEPLINGTAIYGNIALLDRGECPFVTKVANAQAAGAAGVIVANNQGNGLIQMGGDDPAISIPSVFLGQADGETIKAQAAPSPPPQESVAVPTASTMGMMLMALLLFAAAIRRLKNCQAVDNR